MGQVGARVGRVNVLDGVRGADEGGEGGERERAQLAFPEGGGLLGALDKGKHE